jgi:hypothetical protein
VGSLSKVVYDTSDVETPLNATAGIPSRTASQAAPLIAAHSIEESRRNLEETHIVPENNVTKPRLPRWVYAFEYDECF